MLLSVQMKVPSLPDCRLKILKGAENQGCWELVEIKEGNGRKGLMEKEEEEKVKKKRTQKA